LSVAGKVSGWIALPALATIESTVRRDGSFGNSAASDPVVNGVRGNSMKNPLDSLWGTVISGLILTVILYFVVKSLLA
jgi:hypothetical protein